jgi:DNA polymerase III gamma/tau subunit
MAMCLDLEYWLLPQVSSSYHTSYTMDKEKAQYVMRTIRHVIIKKGLTNLLLQPPTQDEIDAVHRYDPNSIEFHASIPDLDLTLGDGSIVVGQHSESKYNPFPKSKPFGAPQTESTEASPKAQSTVSSSAQSSAAKSSTSTSSTSSKQEQATEKKTTQKEVESKKSAEKATKANKATEKETKAKKSNKEAEKTKKVQEEAKNKKTKSAQETAKTKTKTKSKSKHVAKPKAKKVEEDRGEYTISKLRGKNALWKAFNLVNAPASVVWSS